MMRAESAAIDNSNVSLATQSELLRSLRVSPVDLVITCLRRIKQLNPQLNAFVTVLPTLAMEQARQAESELKAGLWRGPLHGIPIGIKDFYDTAGIPTTAAFAHFKDRVPKTDAIVVARLKEAARSSSGKPICTRWEWVRRDWKAILGRFAIPGVQNIFRAAHPQALRPQWRAACAMPP
jgi:Asp-tRNA(Asn)/Glu-tRNA(Gln) amidotransferase A subunit family amidase